MTAENWSSSPEPCHRGGMAGRHWYLTGCAGLLALCHACTSSHDVTPDLSKQKGAAAPNVGPIPKDNPKLGAIADMTPVLERPETSAKRLGYLHAGSRVARAKEPYPGEGCEGGWYPVRPKGFVCVGASASLDMKHPTLAAMSLAPELSQALPYTYARTTKETSIFAQHAQAENSVKKVGKLRARSGLAVVGSWDAKDQEGQQHRLGLMPNGLFVRAADLKAAEGSNFEGIELTKEKGLPVGFVVKRGVNYFKIEKGRPQKDTALEYHERVELSGRFRTIDKQRYWATNDDRWVRHRDVTVVRRLHNYPEFAVKQQKWIDVSIIMGTLVMYEGTTPVFATLVSVGRDRLGDPKTSASTERGLFEVTEKHITDRTLDPKASTSRYEVYDVPWVVSLSSGAKLHGAFWHNRFGIEHTDGALHLSPTDAARLFGWVSPSLPEGWHAIAQQGEDKTLVRIRK